MQYYDAGMARKRAQSFGWFHFFSYWPKDSIDWLTINGINIITNSTCRKIFISQQIVKDNLLASRMDYGGFNDPNCIRIDPWESELLIFTVNI